MRKNCYKLNLPEFRRHVTFNKRAKSLVVYAGLSGIPYDTVKCWVYGGRHEGRGDQTFTTRERAQEFSRVLGLPVNVLFERV